MNTVRLLFIPKGSRDVGYNQTPFTVWLDKIVPIGTKLELIGAVDEGVVVQSSHVDSALIVVNTGDGPKRVLRGHAHTVVSAHPEFSWTYPGSLGWGGGSLYATPHNYSEA